MINATNNETRANLDGTGTVRAERLSVKKRYDHTSMITMLVSIVNNTR